MQSRIDLKQVIEDGRWLAHRYDEQNDAIQFRLVPRESHQSITFLTDLEIGEVPIAVFPREEAMAEVRRRKLPTPRLIFHSAYCCSTLLARALDVPGTSSAFKEPQILNDAVGLRLRGGDPRHVAAVLDSALALLARPLSAGETTVIKPSNLLNPLLPLFVALRPDMRALFLHAPLNAFLASIGRKELEGRLWVRDLMWKLIRLGETSRFGFTQEELFRQTDLQTAALGWLAQQAIIANACAASSTFWTLNSDDLVERPEACLSQLGRTFDLPLDAQSIVRGGAFTTHSKDGREFSSQQRQEERSEGLAKHAREIETVQLWAERVATESCVPLELPNPLLRA